MALARVCGDCGERLERCDDCSLVLCWDCEGVEHDRDHADHEREREARHADIDREFGPRW